MDMDGGVTNNSVAISRFSGSYTIPDTAPPTYQQITIETDATALVVAPAGSIQRYFVGAGFTVSGYLVPGNTFSLSVQMYVSDSHDTGFYDEFYQLPSSTQGFFSYTFNDPFASFQVADLPALRVDADFQITQLAAPVAGTSYANFSGFLAPACPSRPRSPC